MMELKRKVTEIKSSLKKLSIDVSWQKKKKTISKFESKPIEMIKSDNKN